MPQSASSIARHKRVKRARGTAKAAGCYNRQLGLRDCISTKYEWSRVHGSDGLDVFLDYYALCSSCHHAYYVVGTTRPSIQGSKHYRAKLTEEIVLDCRRRHASFDETYETLAREYGISDVNMRLAVLSKTWKHVPMPNYIGGENGPSVHEWLSGRRSRRDHAS